MAIQIKVLFKKANREQKARFSHYSISYTKQLYLSVKFWCKAQLQYRLKPYFAVEICPYSIGELKASAEQN